MSNLIINNHLMDSFDEVVQILRPGDELVYKKPGFGFNIQGEVRQIYIMSDQIFLRLYHYITRKEVSYVINSVLEMVPSIKWRKLLKQKNAEQNPPDLVIAESGQEKKEFPTTLHKVIALVLVLAFLIGVLPALRIPTVKINYSYEEFVKKDFSINKMFQVVTSRLRYQKDRGEYWVTPQTAWNLKRGDCEDFSIIISDYLNRHGIENYLVGLTLKKTSENPGHAVVIAKTEGQYMILDPTYAAEKMGIKSFSDQIPIREVLAKYSTFPVSFYQIPVRDGEKIVVKTLY